jgi:hypothetical protein
VAPPLLLDESRELVAHDPVVFFVLAVVLGLLSAALAATAVLAAFVLVSMVTASGCCAHVTRTRKAQTRRPPL